MYLFTMNEPSGPESSDALLYGPTTSSTSRSDGTREGISSEQTPQPSNNQVDSNNVSEAAHFTSSPQETAQASDNRQPEPRVFVTAQQEANPENVQAQAVAGRAGAQESASQQQKASDVLLYGPTTSSTIRSDGTREGIFAEPTPQPSSNQVDLNNVSEVAHFTSSPQEAAQAFDNRQPVPGVFVTAQQKANPENVQAQTVAGRTVAQESRTQQQKAPHSTLQNIERFASQHDVLKEAEQNKTAGNEAGESEGTIIDAKDRAEQELRNYDKSLKTERPLTQEEVKLLKENFLKDNDEYSKTKEGYEQALKAGHIGAEDLEFLNNRLEAKYQKEFLNRFGDEKGNVTTKSCSITDLSYLYTKKQEEVLQKFTSKEKGANGGKTSEIQLEQLGKKEQEASKAEKGEVVRDRKERNLSRKAVIALGVASGVGFSLVGGAATFPMASIVAGVAGMTSATVEHFLSSNYSNNLLKLGSITDPVQRAKLEKTIQKQEKILKITRNVTQFLRGFTIGSFVGGLAAKIYQNSVAINELRNQPSSTEGVQKGQPSGQYQEQSLGQNQGQQLGQQPPLESASGNLPTQNVELVNNVSEGVLVQNGKVNLPGSAWNGNLAGQATGVLPGGAENFSNYRGGWHEMAPRMLEQDLISSGVTRETLLNNLSTSEIHSLLNKYLADIQGGVSDPDLVQNLKKLGTEGAQKLINIVSK